MAVQWVMVFKVARFSLKVGLACGIQNIPENMMHEHVASMATVVIPYSGKFSYGAYFRIFRMKS